MLTRQAHPQLLSNLPVCQTTVNTTEAPWGCLGQSQIPSNSCSMTSTIIQTAAISATVVAAKEKFPFFLIAKHRVFNVEKMQFHKNWCAGYHLHFIPCPTCWCKGGFQYNSWEAKHKYLTCSGKMFLTGLSPMELIIQYSPQKWGKQRENKHLLQLHISEL